MRRSNEIVDEARSWVGTPFAHQHRTKGAFVDCVGLILGVGADLGLLSISAEDWAPYRNYTRTPNPRKMFEAMNEFLEFQDVPKESAAPDGSIAWFQWREGLPMHLGIMATFGARRTVIHALEPVGKCVEHTFDTIWQSRVDSWWKYPGV